MMNDNERRCADAFLATCFTVGVGVGGYMVYENLQDEDFGERSSGALILGSVTGLCGVMVGIGILYIGEKVGKRCIAWLKPKLYND
jgi:hypothetical protein